MDKFFSSFIVKLKLQYRQQTGSATDDVKERAVPTRREAACEARRGTRQFAGRRKGCCKQDLLAVEPARNWVTEGSRYWMRSWLVRNKPQQDRCLYFLDWLFRIQIICRQDIDWICWMVTYPLQIYNDSMGDNPGPLLCNSLPHNPSPEFITLGLYNEDFVTTCESDLG